MPHITKRTNKKGQVSYYIRAHDGYDVRGDQRRHSMTWRPPEGMTPKKADKQVQIVALQFETSLKSNTISDGSIRFVDFSAKFMDEYAKRLLKLKTWSEYEKKLERINIAIGHIKLNNLRVGHLNSFYSTLETDGVRIGTKCKARVDLPALLELRNIQQTSLAESSGLSVNTIATALSGKNIAAKSADAIAAALELPRDELFAPVSTRQRLSPNSVRGYHRVISSILSKAVKWGYIPDNPALKADLPESGSDEAAYLDEEDAMGLLELLLDEPIKYRTPIIFHCISGLRRGELLGLCWDSVFFDKETIRISQTLNYVAGEGLYVDTPKSKKSARYLKLPSVAFSPLSEHKEWQDERRKLCGDYWKDNAQRVFTREDGAPIHPDSLTGWFTNFASSNGFPGVHLHTLRHTCASMMLADGIPAVVVSRRLGHAQVSTTNNIYAHVLTRSDEIASQASGKLADVVACVC